MLHRLGIRLFLRVFELGRQLAVVVAERLTALTVVLLGFIIIVTTFLGLHLVIRLLVVIVGFPAIDVSVATLLRFLGHRARSVLRR